MELDNQVNPFLFDSWERTALLVALEEKEEESKEDEEEGKEQEIAWESFRRD